MGVPEKKTRTRVESGSFRNEALRSSPRGSRCNRCPRPVRASPPAATAAPPQLAAGPPASGRGPPGAGPKQTKPHRIYQAEERGQKAKDPKRRNHGKISFHRKTARHNVPVGKHQRVKEHIVRGKLVDGKPMKSWNPILWTLLQRCPGKFGSLNPKTAFFPLGRPSSQIQSRQIPQQDTWNLFRRGGPNPKTSARVGPARPCPCGHRRPTPWAQSSGHAAPNRRGWARCLWCGATSGQGVFATLIAPVAAALLVVLCLNNLGKPQYQQNASSNELGTTQAGCMHRWLLIGGLILLFKAQTTKLYE